MKLKKLINWLYNSLAKPDVKKDEIQGCLTLTFKGQTTEQSIFIATKYLEGFNSELNQRHIKVLKELELIENYFDPKRKPIYKVDVKDPQFEKPIKV
jgi:hypothetical protein